MKLLSVARTAAMLVSNNNNNNNNIAESSALSIAGRSLLQRLTRIAAASPGERRRGLQDENGDGDENEEEGNSFFFNQELDNALDQAMEFCDIDLESLSFFDGDDLDLDLELMQYYAKLFAGVCNDNDEIKFKTALDSFQACSSFDLVGAMENLDDALVGAAFECALVSAPAIKAMVNASQLDDFELPRECSEAFLGRNPLGNMIRNTVLYPDKILPCFTQLSLDIPHCTLEAWPIPVVGPILKRIGCFVGRGKYFLEIVSEENLDAFDDCLPGLEDEINEGDCDDILYECEYIDETEFLLPVPFSDLTMRVAKESGLSHVVTRYENFFNKCDYERWEGWDYASKDFNLGGGFANYGGEIPEPNFDGSPSEACSGQSLAASSSSSKESGGMFGWGFFAGLLAASFVWSAVILFRAYKQRGKLLRDFETSKPTYTDTTTGQPNLNAVRDTAEDYSHTEDSTDHEDFNTVHLA
jgi:hypothetical protein